MTNNGGTKMREKYLSICVDYTINHVVYIKLGLPSVIHTATKNMLQRYMLIR